MFRLTCKLKDIIITRKNVEALHRIYLSNLVIKINRFGSRKTENIYKTLFYVMKIVYLSPHPILLFR